MKAFASPKMLEWVGLLSGAVLLLVTLLLPSRLNEDALLAYLAPFIFFTGLSAGSLALLLVPALTGGLWGVYQIGRASCRERV